jgi:hypothetical protein
MKKLGDGMCLLQNMTTTFWTAFQKVTTWLCLIPEAVVVGRVAEDAICRAISKASEMRPQRTPITLGQKKAWEKLAKEFGDELCSLTYGSSRDHAEAGIKAMQDEADKLMKHDGVRKAYEQFQLICELTKERHG